MTHSEYDDYALVREMGITHADFLRIFPRFAGTRRYELSGVTARIEWSQGHSATIEVGEELQRKIGMMRIPYATVAIRFQSESEAPDAEGFRADFLGAFDRAFQKGGG